MGKRGSNWDVSGSRGGGMVKDVGWGVAEGPRQGGRKYSVWPGG